MSKFRLCKCTIENCKLCNHVIYAELSHFKGHLKDHDYKELQQMAHHLGLLEYPSERRSPQWLVDRIAEASTIREIMKI